MPGELEEQDRLSAAVPVGRRAWAIVSGISIALAGLTLALASGAAHPGPSPGRRLSSCLAAAPLPPSPPAPWHRSAAPRTGEPASPAAAPPGEKKGRGSGSAAGINAEDYAGTATCATCHEEIARQVSRTVHGAAKMPARIPRELWGCEGCHGPGRAHAEAGGDVSKIRRLSEMDPEKRSETCLACHGGQDERINFRRSEHQASQVSCDACHASHGGETKDRLLRKEPNALCFSCHGEVRNAFALPFHHKVPEGAIKCVDCHNQHGGFSQQQRLFGTDRACLKCHTDKQGPFTFEHLALRLEGCTGCHLPHGSNNPRLLTRSEQRFLCLECHSQILSPAEEFPSVGTPAFHNLTQSRFQSCTTCHVMIHGSNTSHVFFE